MVTQTSSTAAALCVLPGVMCDSRLFGGLAALRSPVVIIDGFYDGARSLGAMADHALDRLPPRFSLMGHSMGGRVALEILRRAPDRVARLALVSTGVHPVQPGEADKRFALRDLGRSRGMAALVDCWLPPMLAQAHRGDDRLVASLRAMCLEAGLATYEAQIEALLDRPQVTSLLPTIACPTLVVTGEFDNWASPEQHRAIAAAIPGAQLAIIPGAGHMLPIEAPAAFNETLEFWLATPAR